MYMIISVNRRNPGTGTIYALSDGSAGHMAGLYDQFSFTSNPDDLLLAITPDAVQEIATGKGGIVTASVLVAIYDDTKPSHSVVVTVAVPATIWKDFFSVPDHSMGVLCTW